MDVPEVERALDEEIIVTELLIGEEAEDDEVEEAGGATKSRKYVESAATRTIAMTTTRTIATPTPTEVLECIRSAKLTATNNYFSLRNRVLSFRRILPKCLCA